MMNNDKNNDKIRKIVKKGLTLSLCAVLAGGVAAGSFEGFSALTGETTVQAADKNDAKLTYAKSEKIKRIPNLLTANQIPRRVIHQREASMYLILQQKHFLPLYLSQQNLFRRFRTITECTECSDMLHSSRNRR